MKLLVAVKSCMMDLTAGSHEVIRKTWGKYFDDVKFFVGGNDSYVATFGVEFKPDEVRLDVGDEYLSLSEKTQAICKFAVDNQYDFVYLCDNDTFVIPEKLKELCRADYVGYFTAKSASDRDMYAFGGTGYILSAKAAKTVADAPDPDELMEDHFVGDCLVSNREITKLRVPFAQEVAWHFPKNTYGVLKYHPSFPWQEMMEEQHITKRRTERTYRVGIGRPPVYETVPLRLATCDL